MKSFIHFLKFLWSVFLRLAHVIEHLFCDECPVVDFDDEEDDI